MGKTRSAWIQSPNYLSYDIGEVSREEIDKLWGSRWAQKCIRDIAEDVAVARFSPLPKAKSQEFCSPILGFENETATLTLCPWADVKPAILYGAPLQEFSSWTVSLQIKRGRRLLGIIPLNYFFEMVVSQDEALELIQLFYDCSPAELIPQVKNWREQINENYRRRYRTNEGLLSSWGRIPTPRAAS